MLREQARPRASTSPRWRAFWTLLVATLASVVLVLPYVLSVMPPLPTPIPIGLLLLATLAQNGVLFGGLIALGLWLGPRVGLGFPGLEAWWVGQREGIGVWQRWRVAIGLGVITALVIIGLSLLFPLPTAGIPTPTWWQGLLATFYGGIAEEVLLRLGIMTLLALGLGRLWRGKDGRPAAGALWASNIGAALLFGAGHLPFASTLMTLTPSIIITIIGLNAVGGIVFGWLYWRRGLGSAMVAHASADIVLHVLTPLVVLAFGVGR